MDDQMVQQLMSVHHDRLHYAYFGACIYMLPEHRNGSFIAGSSESKTSKTITSNIRTSGIGRVW